MAGSAFANFGLGILKETLTQVGHGFAAGDVIYYTGAAYAKAQANAAATSQALGVVESVSGDNFTVVYGGRISNLSGLTSGGVYYLSEATAGLLTVTEPTGANISKPLLIARSATEGVVINQRGLVASSTSSALPRGYIDGLILSNNAGDATNDIDIATGVARDGSNTYDLSLTGPFTKRLDAAWAVGSGNGGLDTGAKAANTWYHIWAIRKDSDGSIDALFSTSATAPTMPAGYTAKRRIGAVRTSAGSAILAFTQKNNSFVLSASILDVDVTNPGIAAVLRTLTTPLGIKTVALMNLTFSNTSGVFFVSDPDASDEAPSYTAAPLGQIGGSAFIGVAPGSTQVRVWTNTSSQVRTRFSASVAGNIERIATLGWEDPRGVE